MSPASSPTSTPSSSAYDVRLKPCAGARRLLWVSAWLLLLAGLALVLHLDVAPGIRAVIAAAWLLDGVLSCRRLARAQRVTARIILRADGSALRQDRRGGEVPLTLLPVTVVGRSLAWLRFRGPDRRIYSELLLAADVDREAWRRLQVVWRWRPANG